MEHKLVALSEMECRIDEGDKSSDNFKASLKKLFVVLQTEFTNIGVYCNEFENHGATKARADITLRL
jgi:hypothetical protein